MAEAPSHLGVAVLEALLDALEVAEDAIVEFEAGKRFIEYSEDSVECDLGPAHPRRHEPAEIRAAWDAFRSACETHLEREVRMLVPLLERSERADGPARLLESLLGALRDDHDELERLSRTVRRALLVAEPVRPEVEYALSTYDEHSRDQELGTFPRLLSSVVQVETPVPRRYRTSDDVARSLRAARPNWEPVVHEEVEEPPPTVGSFFRRLLGGAA